MIKTVLKWCNDNHWYLIAGAMIITVIFWTYGCESKVTSLINQGQMVNRSELQNELNYVVGQAKAREENLDRQDAVKQALLDAANIMGTTGAINPSGLINLAASIGGIAFGLSQRQALKNANKTTV
jgi:hypothetical protein